MLLTHPSASLRNDVHGNYAQTVMDSTDNVLQSCLFLTKLKCLEMTLMLANQPSSNTPEVLQLTSWMRALAADHLMQQHPKAAKQKACFSMHV